MARLGLCAAAFLALLQPAWGAVAVTLAWDANSEPNIAGYVLYTGLEPGVYLESLDVGLTTTRVVSGLSGGHTYYFAVTAYNTAGVESDPSVELTVPVAREVPDVPTYFDCYTANVGEPLVITNIVYDQYYPAETLAFELTGPDDARARIHPTSGVFAWMPSAAFGSSTQYFDITVTSDGSPLPSECRTICVVVNDYVAVEIGSMVTRTGQHANVPLTMYASTGITNFCVSIQYPQDRLADIALVDLNPSICSATVTPISGNVARACFTTCRGRRLDGWNSVGQLRIRTLPQSSGFVPLVAISASAVRTDGRPVSHVVGRDGRGVVIGNEPLLETSGNPDGTVWLTVYGKAGATYQILRTRNVWPQPSWQPVTRIVLSGLFHRFQVANDAQLACFIAYEER